MQNENEKPKIHTRQCETCKHTGTRVCTYHGYPETEIPPSCAYKLGTNAEEAMRNLTGTFIDVWSKDRPAYKILESIPDKNNIVIIGVKEDPDGAFVSRKKALEYVRKECEIREGVMYSLLEKIDEMKTTLEDAAPQMEDCNEIQKAIINVRKCTHALQVIEAIRKGEPIYDDSQDDQDND